MSVHQKWIFYCEDANLIFAAIAAQSLCRKAILGNVEPEDLRPTYEFENGVVMHGHATKNGTFVITQGKYWK